MNVTIVGIDCATQPKKIGLACGCYHDGNVEITEALLGHDPEAIITTIVSWLTMESHSLLAIDAPLGWPTTMGEVLLNHYAGQPIDIPPDHLFRRQTDRFIKEKVGKQSLDIGADRIARTAHSALALLKKIRQKVGLDIPLAWGPVIQPGKYAIEVYPAATLKAHDLAAPGYKDPDNRSKS